MDHREHQSLTAQVRRITAIVGVLLLTATLLGTDTVSADPALPAGGVRQEASVEVEVTVSDATQAALLGSRGYDCAIGTCRLELLDGEERALLELGLVLRVVARAITASAVRESAQWTDAAALEVYVEGSNPTDVQIPDKGKLPTVSYITISSAPADAVVTRVVYGCRIVHGWVSQLTANLYRQGGTMAGLWNHQGSLSGTDGGLDDDAEDDADIDLNNREETCFNGLPVNADWQLLATDDVLLYTGYIDSWSLRVYYCYSPLVPWSMSPADGATNVPLDRDLDWSADPLTQSWDVYFGTTNPPPYHGTAASNTYALPTLSCGTHYYWKVVGHNDCGTTDGPVWDFTTIGVPSIPASPSPANHATGVLLDTDLVWAACSPATSYTVRWGTTSPPKNSATTTMNSLALPPLNPNTHYYWYVTALNGSCSISGSTWDFTTGCVPAVPRLPAPVDGATGVALDADLDWADTPGAGSYDVYFGVCSPRLPPLLGSTSSSGYALPVLNPATSYCWRIVAKGVCGETSGPDWDFGTLNPTPTPTLTSTPSATPSRTLSPAASPTLTRTPTGTLPSSPTATRTATRTLAGTPWDVALYLPLLRR